MCAQRRLRSAWASAPGPVWSESSLSASRKLRSLATHWAHSEDSDQTERMPRLIWVFAGRIYQFVGFVTRRLILDFARNSVLSMVTYVSRSVWDCNLTIRSHVNAIWATSLEKLPSELWHQLRPSRSAQLQKSARALVLLVKRNALILYSHFHWTFMFLLLVCVTFYRDQPTIKTSSFRFWDFKSLWISTLANSSEDGDQLRRLICVFVVRIWHKQVLSWCGSYKKPNMSRDMTKPSKWLCTQRRLRSARASAQSDQSLRCALNG